MILMQQTIKKPLLWLGIVMALAIGAVWGVRYFGQDKPVAQETKTPKTYAPVQYPVAEWQTAQDIKKEDTALMLLLGDVAMLEEALDFYGERATKYRYATPSEPPLYVVQSGVLFELTWYHATARDTDEDKAMSVRHAQKAYRLMSAIYGKEASAFFVELLGDKKDKKLPKLAGVVSAKCGAYTCQIVLNKQQAGIKTTKKATKKDGDNNHNKTAV